MGTNQRHDNPFLCNIGSGTMVSDGLSMINVHMSATSFRLAESRIGAKNYLGNDIYYPPDGKTGANVLLGTKTMIPIDGPVRENVGLLGSPAFEIPAHGRSRPRHECIVRCGDAPCPPAPQERLQRDHRRAVPAVPLGCVFRGARALDGGARGLRSIRGCSRFSAARPRSAARISRSFVAIERASLRFGRLAPKLASIYDPYFWFHERHWKLSDTPIASLFAGTPFRNIMYRALGMKVGKMVFDCSQSVTERTLTEVGDFANLNEGAVLQPHSLEEGVFKSDYIRLGSGCSDRSRRLRALRGQHGRPRRARCRLVPDEGRSSRVAYRWRGNPAKLARRFGDPAASCGRRPMRASCASRRSEVTRASLVAGRGKECAMSRQARRHNGRQLARGDRPQARRGARGTLVAPQQSLFDRRNPRFEPDARPPRRLCRQGIVGFLMYDVQPRKASIYRFMIDRKHQGKGYGRAALSRRWTRSGRSPGSGSIDRYMPDNPVAKPFYASFGFVEVGKDEDGEISRIWLVTSRRPLRGRAVDPSLQREINALASPGLLIGHRLISPGDEDALLDEEAGLDRRRRRARRASGAARIVARQLLAHLGLPLRAAKGAVRRADLACGIAGSWRTMTRSRSRRSDRSATSAPSVSTSNRRACCADMLELIATPQELHKIADDPLRGKLLFAAKEAVYKASIRSSASSSNFATSRLILPAQGGHRTGRVVALRYCLLPRVVVLALA
jgi:ribosomal protein S18 acetylase RimI-like enzyme